MKNKESIKKEVQKTLDLLDHPDTLPPDPYFYTRLRARIDSTKHRAGILQKTFNPAFFTFLAVINIGTVVWYFSGYTSQAVNSQDQLTTILATDLNLENDQSGFSLSK